MSASKSPQTLWPCTQVSGVYEPPDPGGGSSCAIRFRSGLEYASARTTPPRASERATDRGETRIRTFFLPPFHLHRVVNGEGQPYATPQFVAMPRRWGMEEREVEIFKLSRICGPATRLERVPC